MSPAKKAAAVKPAEPEKVPTMAEKYADRFKVVDRIFVWTSEDGVTLHLPLRIKERVREQFSDTVSTQAMVRELFAALGVPAEDIEAMLDMDKAYDLDPMYLTWQEVYLDGATPGESGASPG